MTGLSLFLLGHFATTLNDRPVTKFRTRRVQALLAYLVAESAAGGVSHHREALMELLWPGMPPESARTNLRQTLYYLRQSIDDLPGIDGADPIPFLLADRVSVQINPAYPVSSDIANFNQYLDDSQDCWPEAISLYCGDFLADFYLPDANPFEEWAGSHRAAYRRQVLNALDTLTADRLAHGDYDAAESYALRQLEIDDLRESAYRQLMQLYAWSGRQSEALNLYQECLRLLDEELDSPPDETTTALYEAIREGQLPPPPVKPELLVQPAPEEPTGPPASPYRGLFSFREEDAPYFFGRESFVERLVNMAKGHPLVAVIGPSGSGKSSVLHAGLIACLQQEGTWSTASFRPGNQPYRSLAAALLPLLEPEMTETDRLVEIRKMALALEEGVLPLNDVIDRIVGKNSKTRRLLLVADHFEELYTLSPDALEHRRFLESLMGAIGGQQFRSEPAFCFTLAVRADFLGHVLAYRPFADAFQEASLILGPMNREELGRAIEKPAGIQGVTFESGLVERILADVGDEPGNLPLLEFALSTLWERQSDRQLAHADYESTGRVEGALTRYADEVYEGLGQGEKDKAHHVFVQLVRPGQQSVDSRRLSRRMELGEGNWALAQRLADARLVVVDRDPAGQETVELAHETLIRRWGRLRMWLEEDRAFRFWQERLRAALHQWVASNRDEGALLRGVPLDEAERWLVERRNQLSQAEVDFIEASCDLKDRRQAERERQQAEQEQARLARERTRRWITVGLAAGLVIAVVLLALAAWQWNSARQAQAVAEAERDQTQVALSNALASQAELLLDEKLDLSLLLSVEATRKDDTPEARSSLLTALNEDPQLKRFLRSHMDDVRSVAFSPVGNLLASGSADGTILLWDLETGQPLGSPLTGHKDRIWSVAFSPDGRTLASASFDGTIILWDVAAGQPITSPLSVHEDNVWSLAFSPDGRSLASAGADSSIILWDVDRDSDSFGRPIHSSLESHEGIVTSVAFNPDGQILASGGVDQSVILWDVAGNSPAFGQPLGPPLTGHTGAINAIAFSSEGGTMASASQDGTIILWDVSAATSAIGTDASGALTLVGEPVGSPLTGHDDWVTDVAFSPDGRSLASAGRDNNILLWDLTPVLTEGGTTSPIQSQALTGHVGPVWSVAFSPDGRSLASGSADDTIILWEPRPKQPLASFLSGHKDRVWDIDYSPDGRTLATASKDGQVILWDVASKEQNSHLPEKGSLEAFGIAYSPDGHTLATGYADGTIRLWDTNAGTPIDAALSGHSLAVWSLEFSPDGRTLASAGADTTIRLWDVSIDSDSFGRMLGQPLIGHAGTADAVAFSPDGKLLASGGGNMTLLWDLSSVETTSDLESESRAIRSVRSIVTDHGGSKDFVDFSPDGRLLARASSSGVIGIVDVTSGTQVSSLTHPTAALVGLKFGPDDRTLVSASSNGNVVLWDVPTVRPIGPPLASEIGLNSNVAFRPDGNQLAIGAEDGSVILWDISLASWQSLACERANRNLTEEEWRQFFGDEPYRLTCPDLPSGAEGGE